MDAALSFRQLRRRHRGRLSMRNRVDFSSWQGSLTTLLGLALVSLVAVGIRRLVMQAVQQRRERANRQINERWPRAIRACLKALMSEQAGRALLHQ